MSASAAEIVLKTKTLRWSHPDKFDDSLDVAKGFEDAMNKDKQKKIRDAYIDLVANPHASLNKKNTNKISKFLSSSISLFGSDKTSAISELKKGPVDISRAIAGINECWKNNIRNNSRILCLGIENNNHRLWNDYAEAYKGAVIELACREESDSPWRMAEPVEYVPERELFLTAEDWAVVMCLENIVGANYIIKKCCTKKAKDNEHKWFEQNEWRVPSFRRHHETGLVSDYDVNPNDFSAVYFGHKMDFKTQDNLLSLLDGELAHVSAFRCDLDSSQNITFSKIK